MANVTSRNASSLAMSMAVGAETTAKELSRNDQKNILLVFMGLFTIGSFLAGAETAITTMWPWKVRELSDEEGEGSVFRELEKDVTRYLTTILIATTLCTILSTSLITELATSVFGPASLGIITILLTIFFLFFGEILPKSLAVHNSQLVARAMLPVIHAMSVVLYPVGKILAFISNMFLKAFGLPSSSEVGVSEQELRLIVAGANASGSIEKFESRMITNVLDLNEKEVQEMMCPRVDMVAIDSQTTLRQFLVIQKKTRFSRMPVYAGTIDNIIGVVYAKSLLVYLDRNLSPYSDMSSGENSAPADGSSKPKRSAMAQQAYLDEVTVGDLAEGAFFVPETMSSWVALEEMRKRRLHMAIVVDEYGGTAGLVTLEDILEELVGEIYDEDDSRDPEDPDMTRVSDNEFRILGQADLELVVEALKLEISEEEMHDWGTISGILCHQMGGIPAVGDWHVLGNVCFTVTMADERRILQLRAEVLDNDRREHLTKLQATLEDEEEKMNNPDERRQSLGISGGASSRNGNGPSFDNSRRRISLGSDDDDAEDSFDPSEDDRTL
eukprot:CAMPEP_0182449158 /NCGR_PEP_ID=MMETSP1172-20130603/32151_1 /TAXON_ID=708627 /ORGANISM="Timspurckia oligopyrenoides, Strain CCMP3278" /LENGTH=556 /DNA_ID=CAMNT_0024646309 /DNA_START=512 /DNA_END=2182 /DNA_ORIENTATION=+